MICLFIFITLVTSCKLIPTEIKLDQFYPTDSTSLHCNSKYLFQVNNGGDILVWNFKERKFPTTPIVFHRNQSSAQIFIRVTTSKKYAIFDSIIITNQVSQNGRQGQIILLDLINLSIIQKFTASIAGAVGRGWGSCYTISNTEKYLAFIDPSDKYLNLYNIAEKTLSRFSVIPFMGITQISFFPNDTMIVIKNSGNVTIAFWDLKGTLLKTLVGPDDFSDILWSPVSSVQLTDDLKYLVTHSSNIFAMAIWDLNQNKIIYKSGWVGDYENSGVIFTGGYISNGGYTSNGGYISNGEYICISSWDNDLIFWNSGNISKLPLDEIPYAYDKFGSELLVGTKTVSLVKYDGNSASVLCEGIADSKTIYGIVTGDQNSFYSLSDRLWEWKVER